jgi:hypothetical protein
VQTISVESGVDERGAGLVSFNLYDILQSQHLMNTPASSNELLTSTFEHIVCQVFDKFGHVFLQAHERNLNDFIEQVWNLVHSKSIV